MKTGHQMPKRPENAKDSNEIRWKWSSFEELSKVKLYDILQIRQQVFVLEQNCLYQDIDRLDQSAWHLLAINKNAQLMGYLRVVAPGKKYKEPSIGRVLVHPDQRKKGLGKRLLTEGMRRTQAQFPSQDIRISAQLQLQAFYENAGFVPVGNPYLEDDIPHIEMLFSA